MKRIFKYASLIVVLIASLFLIYLIYIKYDNNHNLKGREDISIKVNKIKVVEGLVRVKDIDNTIFVDLKYSTSDNFTGKIVYPFKTCLLRKETAEKLKNANKELNKYNCRIKIYDGYRPPYAQQIFWDIVKDERYVANPGKKASIHSNGGAVDVTLTDMNGNELEMPSRFDDFTGKGSRNNKVISARARENLNILTSVMVGNGFDYIDTEWWHYIDKDAGKYEVVDVDPGLFQE